MHNYLGGRLAKWRLDVLPGHRPDRCRAALQTVGKKTAPKIVAAVIRALFDGWLTWRLCPVAAHSRWCMLGCEAPDDIVH